MTSRTNPARGFTLLEMLVVLVILGLITGLVLARGPARSSGLELRAQSQEIVQTLRAARARAIASNAPVIFRLDPGELPRHMQGVIAPKEIVFAPDGSASGGLITLAEGEARVQIAVDWLTGRAHLTPLR